MASQNRIYHITRGFHMKHNQAMKAIEECSCVWVEFGKSVRSTTLSEAIQLRNQQAKDREPLAKAELPHLRYEASASGKQAASLGYKLILQANALCAGV